MKEFSEIPTSMEHTFKKWKTEKRGKFQMVMSPMLRLKQDKAEHYLAILLGSPGKASLRK